MAEQVKVREVGPRDGFQNEPEVIATGDKVRLIDMLARTGVRRLEVTSFVRADVIPQLADAGEVLAAVDIPDEVSVSVLIPNERGLDNALALRERFQEVNCFLSASETHNQKNVNRSIEESLAGLEEVLARAGEGGGRREGSPGGGGGGGGRGGLSSQTFASPKGAHAPRGRVRPPPRRLRDAG